MKVTRDVIYDLLPTYFAGDASDDSRSLIEEFFASDPEFGRMAERFRRMNAERPSEATLEEDRAKIVFDRARARVKLRMAALIWGLGAVFPLAMALVIPFHGQFGFRHAEVLLGTVFGAAALSTWLMSLSPHPEWWYAAFTGDGTKSKKPGR